ncbi:MAG: hypothetical protein IJZ60_00665 [Bacteroides sp.]|nr:hypothetical protein [Bacteroides sp.]
MRVNFLKPIMGIDRNPLKNKNGEEFRLSDEICLHLFNADKLKGVPLSDEQKYKVYKLCMRISDHPESVDISTEEGTLIKGICSDRMSAGAYGQVVDIIEANV